MNAVHGSIIENLKLIEIVYEPTVEAFKGDRTNTSDSKEVTVNQFVESYLPTNFQVKKQSKIYSKTQETNNIDCVILAPNHPRLITPKREVVLAEGVFAAIEVKPDISTLTDKSEFYRGLKQIKSIKNINRSVEKIDLSALIGKPKRNAYYDKIPALIFASKSSSLENTINFIKKKVDEGVFNDEELPDVIVSLNKGIIFYSPLLNETGLGKIISSKGITVPNKGFVTIESDEKEKNLIGFLKLLLNFSLPTIQVSKFIVNEYLDVIDSGKLNKIYELKNAI